MKVVDHHKLTVLLHSATVEADGIRNLYAKLMNLLVIIDENTKLIRLTKQ